MVNLTDSRTHSPTLTRLLEGREQLTKKIDPAYQESLKANKLKTVTSTEANVGVDIIEKTT